MASTSSVTSEVTSGAASGVISAAAATMISVAKLVAAGCAVVSVAMDVISAGDKSSCTVFKVSVMCMYKTRTEQRPQTEKLLHLAAGTARLKKHQPSNGAREWRWAWSLAAVSDPIVGSRHEGRCMNCCTGCSKPTIMARILKKR
jgi:hypothetical protein